MKNFKRTKYSCYFAYLATAAVFSLPPLLFVTFREMYGISYTLLGTLVLVNFCTQFSIDMIFTIFAKHFNIKYTIRLMPVLTSLGLLIYAIVPTLFPQYAYIGFVIGTVIFSVSAGLCEVLISPMVASIPSETPDKDMSLLHSLYGYGVVGVVVISTIFLKIFGTENWMYLTVFWALLPIVAFILFCTSPMPPITISHDKSKTSDSKAKFILTLCVLCIFFGSAAENSMTNWISGYMETALNIPKVVGDILGMALFATLLAITRTVYAKYGKNITNVLLISMSCAAVLYLITGFSKNVIVGAVSCVLMGICTSMLWPGTLIMMEEKLPSPGVTAYALMAASGDFGASIAPQLLGIITDKVAVSDFAIKLSETTALAPEQIGMKAGMIVASFFPILGVGVLIFIKTKLKTEKK